MRESLNPRRCRYATGRVTTPTQVTKYYWADMKLIFEDYFRDLQNWNFEEGFVRNQEPQYYTDKNVEFGDGLQIIGKAERVRNELYNPGDESWVRNREYAEYTSSSLNTRGKFEFRYGTLEVKARIPVADGAWPAIWLMGSEDEWPFCDEIDVMEQYLCEGAPTILANFMWSSRGECNWSTKQIALEYFKSKSSNWQNEFHVWKLEWREDYLGIYIDNELINQISTAGMPGDAFRKKHYILLNLAIGKDGVKPKEVDLPLIYEVEYVRVYQI